MTVPHPVECEIMPDSDVMDLLARHVEFIGDVFASKALIMADKLAFQNFGGVSKTIIAALEKNKGKGGKLYGRISRSALSRPVRRPTSFCMPSMCSSTRKRTSLISNSRRLRWMRSGG